MSLNLFCAKCNAKLESAIDKDLFFVVVKPCTCEPKEKPKGKPKIHKLDKMIKKALEDGLILSNSDKDFYSKTANKGWLKQFAEELRYQSIRWAWRKWREMTGEGIVTLNQDLINLGKGSWICNSN